MGTFTLASLVHVLEKMKELYTSPLLSKFLASRGPDGQGSKMLRWRPLEKKTPRIRVWFVY
jgi:hypothetical protein